MVSQYHYRLSDPSGQAALIQQLLAHAYSQEPLTVTGARMAIDELSARRSNAEETRDFALLPLSADFGDNTSIVAQDTTTGQWGAITTDSDGVTISVVVE